ncbi:Tol-Pal system beta propeller repeat protein TolB [Sandaracinobacteroides sp. A072]|uniref:Tol-Pal system beta propeller repeat protein TolB n=1 Tax=Sandaracinobacteroides sp. A072 TaxID=3461146 RepID=UPI0040426D27
MNPAPLLLRALALLLVATPAAAQLRVDITSGTQAPMPIAVPAFATSAAVATPAGDTAQLGRQVAAIIAGNLGGTGLFRPVPAESVPVPAMADIAAPRFPALRMAAAQALVTGFVSANPDGTLTVGCYLHDVFSEEQLVRQGFTVTPAGWRRAAHKCSDLVYARLTGESGYFDSRIVYVAESGPRTKRVKRLAIMDQDGANHRFLTSGQSLVLMPRFSPASETISYMSFANDRPRLWLYNITTGRQESVGDFDSMSFAGRFSPDGRTLLMSVTRSGNADILAYDIPTRRATRLTSGNYIDTSPSFSPDGKRIVFESDRGGSQQLYVMNADGSGVQRISFGDGRAGSPVWSPRGDLIAFTRITGGKFRIAVIRPDGSGERLLTDSWQDESPSWSPNGRVILFTRAEPNGRSSLRSIDLIGRNDRRIPTPLDASDPAWGPLLP